MTFECKIIHVSFKFKNMKKIILAIVAATFMLQMSSAQEEPMDLRDKVTFGVKAGVNLANVYDRKGQDFNNDAKFGLATGAFLSIPFSTYVGVQPEVLYSQKGFKSTGLLGDFTRTTNWLDVPMYLAVKPSPTITLLAGPQYSYLLKGKYDFKSALGSGGFNNDDPRKSMWCVAGGVDLNLDNIVISGRAGWDLQENNKNGTTTTPRYKNVWIQATFGFRF
ncbi:MAG TPA: PorT family protein [Prolixibacteraceae bacterium]|jgi:hypothetical protein|nr:PorT family protein [Prolixibacteraceae bacterium]